MRCPKCGSTESSVIDSRAATDEIRRRRECDSCQHRFTTFERLEIELPLVVKKDGRRESFDRSKIRAGFVRACEKRPVSIERIDESVSEVERKVCEMCVKEVASSEIGDIVMDALKDLDEIAYVRFASVYQEFSELHQFAEALKALSKPSSVAKRAKKAIGG